MYGVLPSNNKDNNNKKEHPVCVYVWGRGILDANSVLWVNVVLDIELWSALNRELLLL